MGFRMQLQTAAGPSPTIKGFGPASMKFRLRPNNDGPGWTKNRTTSSPDLYRPIPFKVAGATAYSLLAVVANITFLGTSDTMTIGRFLASTAANISFLGTSDTPTVGRFLTAQAANITFLGKSHTLTVQQRIDYVLQALAANISFLGKLHEMLPESHAPETQTLFFHATHGGRGTWTHIGRRG